MDNNEIKKLNLEVLKNDSLSYFEKDLKINLNPLKKDIEELEKKLKS